MSTRTRDEVAFGAAALILGAAVIGLLALVLIVGLS